MSVSFTLAQEASFISVLPPAADAAGRTTTNYFTMKNGHKAYLVFFINQGNAATIVLTPLVATAVAGTGSTTVPYNVRWWACLNATSSDLLVRGTDATTYTTDAGTNQKIIVCEVDPGDLNQASNTTNYTCLGASTGASNVANITSCIGILTPLRYAAEQPPTAIVN